MGILEHVASRCAIACAALSGTSRSASTPALVSGRDNLGPCTRCVRHSMAICSANDTNRDGGILLGVEIPCRFSEPGNRYRLTDAQITRRSEEHTSELQSHLNLVCRLLLEKK